MPVAPVDGKGTVLYYEDSGPPNADESEAYLTLVLIHGLVFHGAIFHPLLPYASKYRVRLVFVNMRDFPGSSEFSQEELDALGSTDPDVQTAATHAVGQDIALCLQHLIRTLGLPPITESEGKRTGGVALLGWSLGNFPTLAMLASGHQLPDETRDILGRYLRTVVMYDHTTNQLGVDPPVGCYFPLRDSSLSPDECRETFCRWITYYWTPVNGLQSVTENTLAARKALHEEPGANDVTARPTVDRMTEQQYKSVVHLPMFHQSYPTIRHITKETHSVNFQKAVFNTGGLWPNVDILCVWCDRTLAQSVWAARCLWGQSQDDHGSAAARKVNVVKLTGGNHFAHWDDPEGFLKLLCTHL